MRELSEQEQADHDRAAAQIERDSPQQKQRQEMVAFIREVVGEEVRRQLPLLVRQHLDQAELRARIEARLD